MRLLLRWERLGDPLAREAKNVTGQKVDWTGASVYISLTHKDADDDDLVGLVVHDV